MEVLGVNDFDLLFITERPAAGYSGVQAIAPNASGDCLECQDH